VVWKVVTLDGALGSFEKGHPNKKRNNNNNKMSGDMGSVPDLKIINMYKLIVCVVVIVVGTRLLTAGEVIQMWHTADQTSGSVSGAPVEFYFDEQDQTSAAVPVEWHCVWQCRPANPITLVKFSSDSLLFATVGKVCCLSSSCVVALF